MITNTSRIVTIAKIHGARHTLKRGEELFGGDDSCQYLYMIEHGCVMLSHLDVSGNRLSLHLLSENDWFNELSLLYQGKHDLIVKAVEETKLLRVAKDRLLGDARANPHMLFELLHLVGARMQATQCKMEQLVFKGVIARIAYLLLHLADTHGEQTQHGLKIMLRLTQQDFADLTGITRTNISTSLSNLYSLGVLKKGKCITICDPQRLKKIAQTGKVNAT